MAAGATPVVGDRGVVHVHARGLDPKRTYSLLLDAKPVTTPLDVAPDGTARAELTIGETLGFGPHRVAIVETRRKGAVVASDSFVKAAIDAKEETVQPAPSRGKRAARRRT